MKNLYLYFSGTGNTKYVVKQFVDRYEQSTDYTIQSIEEQGVNFSNLIEEAKLVIIAYPIHEGLLPHIMNEFLIKYKEHFRNKDIISICTQLIFSGDGAALPVHILKDVDVKEEGFVDHPTVSRSGASPDGLVRLNGLIEIKCPQAITHTEMLQNGNIPKRYIHQMQWQLACTGAKWVDFISYNPNFPVELQLFVSRVDRDNDYIAELEAEVVKFLDEVEQTILKLKE